MRSVRLALPVALAVFVVLCVGIALFDHSAASRNTSTTASSARQRVSSDGGAAGVRATADGKKRPDSLETAGAETANRTAGRSRSPHIPWPLPAEHSEAVEQIRKQELESVDLSEGETAADATGDVHPVGTVHDAATGQPITGGRILATFYYGTDDPLSAGHPPLAQQEISLDDGALRVPRFRPSDPRLLVHLQVEHPDYEPQVFVLKRLGLFPLRWEQREIALRRAVTVPVRFVTPDRRSLPRVPVLVTAMRDAHALIEKQVVAIAHHATGRYTTPGRPAVRYTDDRGFLQLAYSDYAYSFVLLHPLLLLAHDDPVTKTQSMGTVQYHLPEFTAGREARLTAVPRAPQTFVVRNQDGEPIVDAEVEVRIDNDDFAIRSRTNDNGQLFVGIPKEAEPPWPPLSARVTVLTPDYFERSTRVYLPSQETDVYIPARPAHRLRLRTVTGAPPVPVAPAGIELLRSSTLIRASADGVVEYSGALQSDPGAADFLVRGYLPLPLNIPATTAGSALADSGDVVVDLGDVLLDPGLSRQLVLDDAPRSALQNAVLSLSSFDRPQFVARYPLRGKTLTVSGLEPIRYDVAVVGPGLDAFATTFDMEETLEDEPLYLPLSATEEETIRVSGRLVDGTAEELVLAQVIERFFIFGESAPIAMEPYAVSPDGSFGSTRKLRGVEGVHLSIVTPDDKAAELTIPRPDGEPTFRAGAVRLLRRPHAEISFTVAGLGRVDPPLHVSIEGEDELGVVARFRLKNRRLYIDNLTEGLYHLRWKVGDGAEESLGFEVKGVQSTKIRAVRSPLPEEVIEVRMVDRDGEPVPDAKILSEGGAARVLGDFSPEPPDELSRKRVELDPGVQLVKIRPREANRFSVRAKGFLPTHVVVEPGEVVPTEIVLIARARAHGIVLDAVSLAVRSAELVIEWEPVTPQPVTYGEPVHAIVQDGEFEVVNLPSMLRRFTFRLADSAVSVTQILTLAETDEIHDLGTLWMRETRSLRGTILLPDNGRAAGASIAIVEAHEVERLPLRDPIDFATVRHRTETDEQGAFLLENLPIDLDADLVLLAHLDGYSDAYETPIDLTADTYTLELAPAAELALDVGYEDGLAREGYRFTLEYQSDPTDVDTRVALGEIPAQFFGLNRFVGVEPGLYRVRWGLSESYEPIPLLVEEVIVTPGIVAELRLLLEGRELHGEAALNGKPLKRGWIVLTDRPGVAGGSRAALVVDGQFVMVEPPMSPVTFGAVIPEDEPQPQQNIVRGEALPVRISGYALTLRGGFLNFDYSGHKMRLKFSPEFLGRYPGATLSFSHYSWDGERFDHYKDSELIETPFVDFHLYPPGIHRFTVRSARGSLLLTRPIVLGDRDQTVSMK